MNELVKIGQNMPAISKEKLVQYLSICGVDKNITDKEREMFLEIAMLNNLNPFKRDIYISAYGEGSNRTLSIVTGYEVYIRRAEESGLLDGWKVETTGLVNDLTLKAKVTIFRKNFSHPFEWEVLYSENVKKTGKGEPNRFWREQPEHMTKKVAISQGFRLCFNQVLGGMPYTQDEMPETIDVSHEEVKSTEPAPKNSKISDKKLSEALEKMPQNPVKMLEFLKTRELTGEQKEQINTAIFKFLQDLDINQSENIQLQDAVLKCYPLPKEMIDFLVDTTTNNPQK